jgi:chromosome segregation ATPase
VAKPAAPATDAKKRLSTVPASKVVSDAAESEKIAELQGKLSESEATIDSLKEEMQIVQAKMALFAQSAEEESSKVETATEAIRVEHASKVEKHVLDHQQEIRTLQSKLQEAEIKYKELEQKSVQDLENARKSSLDHNDTQTAGVLDDLKASHQAELERLEKELGDEKAYISRLRKQLDRQTALLEEVSKTGEQKDAAALERHSQLEIELAERVEFIENLKGEQQQLSDTKEKEITAVKEEASGQAALLEARIAELEKKLSSAEGATDKVSTQLLEKDNEISQQTDIINALKTEIDQHKAEIANLKTEIQELHNKSNEAEEKTKDHERALAGLKAENDSNTATLTAHHDQELSEAKEALDAANKQLQNLRDDLDGSAADSQKHIEVINDLKIGHAVELQSLQEKIQASERAQAVAKSAHEESANLAKEAADQELHVLREKIASLEADLQAKDENISALEQNLASLVASNQGASTEQEVALKSVQDELAALNISLVEKTREVDEASEKHLGAINILRADHTAELEKIKSELAASHDKALSSLQTSHDELLSSREALKSSNAETIEALKAQLKAARDEGAAKATVLLQSHQKEIAQLNRQIEDDQAKLRTELESSQASKAAELDSNHSKAIEELLSAHESKIANLRGELEASHGEKVASLQKTHDAALAGLGEQLSKANMAAADTSLVDQLKQQVAELEARLSDAEAKATALIEENTAKHVQELSKAREDKAAVVQQYESARAQLDELQQSFANHEISKTQFETVSKQLSTVEEELATLRSTHEKVLGELELVKDHNRAMEDKISTGEKELNEQIGKNMQLLTQLTDVDSNISASRKRLRELEAELAARKENDADGANPKSSGLAASRWAATDEETQEKEGSAVEGEDLGSSIEGTVGLPR